MQLTLQRQFQFQHHSPQSRIIPNSINIQESITDNNIKVDDNEDELDISVK